MMYLIKPCNNNWRHLTLEHLIIQELLIFTEYTHCPRHCSELFMCVNLFQPLNPMR